MTPERLTELRAWFAEGHKLKSRRYGAELIDEVNRLRAALELIRRRGAGGERPAQRGSGRGGDEWLSPSRSTTTPTPGIGRC